MPSRRTGLSTLCGFDGGSYDVVDFFVFFFFRIVLNAYFCMGQCHGSGEGSLCGVASAGPGSDETLGKTPTDADGRPVQPSARGYAKAHDIPVIDCSEDTQARPCERNLAKTTVTQGLFWSWSSGAGASVGISAKHHRTPENAAAHMSPILVS